MTALFVTYLLQIITKVSEVCKIAKNAFKKYQYCIIARLSNVAYSRLA
jgi:hypothetical protein